MPKGQTKQNKQQNPKAQGAWAINTLPLVYDEKCKVLILGSFPGQASRANGSYYFSKKNKFWKAIESITKSVTGMSLPTYACQKNEYLLKHHIALWDVCACCNIVDSRDSTIKNAVTNPICCLIKHSCFKKVFCNGDKAYELFIEMCDKNGVEYPQGFVEKLPSTSSRSGWNSNNPLNNNFAKWQVIAQYI